MTKILKNLLIIAFTFIFCILISNYAFANNMLENGRDAVRNTVGGAENVVENAGKATTNGVRSGLNGVENVTENSVDKMKDGVNAGSRTTTNENTYSAQRTATNSPLAETNGNVWSWLMLAVVALVVIGFIWYYAMQRNRSNQDRHE